ncbi:alpha/beta fold hydrolase [Hymenobacter sp. BT730]|uniref:alpha/beta fold hydrolase n=1 Tax=Hymenobacter sp. BT730 TaxID=3063332 RepID=UPI0026DEB0EE|nr:alpha/beta fold hydrolase [Hymenobacter sp. BT730]
MKPHLLLLHGALGSEVQLKQLARELGAFFRVHTFSFCGHGGRPLVPADFTMPHFAQEVLHFIQDRDLAAVHVFGYSMGGYAALVAALSAGGRIKSVTTLGTKFNWAPDTVATEARLLNAEAMREKVPQFAAQLEQLHAPTLLPELLNATAAMMQELGNAPLLTPEKLASLTIPVQILVGELDKTAGVDVSEKYAAYIPHGTFEVIMNTLHPLERVNPDLLASRIIRFSEEQN